MSFRTDTSRRFGPIVGLAWIGVFALAYLAASYLDLWTTELALARPDASEANIYATSGGRYSPTKAWAITALSGVLMMAWFAFGVFNAHRVAPEHLQRPMRSFLHLHSNPLISIPWSRRAIDRSPLHALAIPIAFVAFRVLAAFNNALIAAGLDGPISTAIRLISSISSPVTGFLIAVVAFFVVIILALSPLAARLVRLANGQPTAGATPAGDPR